MKYVTPQVHLIARTLLNRVNVGKYLQSIGAEKWLDGRQSRYSTTDPDTLVEIGGRVCYRSFAPGLNPNVQKIRKDSDKYLANIVKSAHGSVLEHSNLTFLITGVSRVFTHELVRHRAGCAFSQESLRYIRLDHLDFVDPKQLFPGEVLDFELNDAIDNYIMDCEHFQQMLIAKLIQMDMKFDDKKKLTSWFRRFAPIGLATSIMWTANLRALRHIIPLRTTVHAEVEMRRVMKMVGEQTKIAAPGCFQDMVLNADDEWIVESVKV